MMKQPTFYSDPEHRYDLAAQELISLQTIPLGILDVGGYKSRETLLTHKLKEIEFTSANVGSAWYVDEEPHHFYDGEHLPFEDRSFPAVISVDTLEHVVREQRQKFVKELIRVADQRVVILTPFCDDGSPIEAVFEDYAERCGLELKPAAKEHLELGLPTSEELSDYANGHNFSLSYATPKKDYLCLIVSQIMNVAFMGEASDELNKQIQQLHEQNFSRNGKSIPREEAYRAVLVIDREAA